MLVTTAAGASVLLAVATGQVWARSGSPWLWVLAAGLLATSALDGVWSWWAMRSVEIEVDARGDGQVATPLSVHVSVRRPHAPVRVRASSVGMVGGRTVPAMSTAVGLVGPASGDLSITVGQRGRIGTVWFDVVCTAPLGLVGVRRVVVAELATPVAVGPDPWPAPVVHSASGQARAEPAAGRATELTRGIRPLVTGDGHRIVHWPATARAGRLMVREFDVPQPSTTVVVVDLGPTPGAVAEQLARVAARWTGDQLSTHHVVELVTRTDGGEHRALVRDGADLNCRLADAVCGAPVSVPDGDCVRFDPSSITGER